MGTVGRENARLRDVGGDAGPRGRLEVGTCGPEDGRTRGREGPAPSFTWSSRAQRRRAWAGLTPGCSQPRIPLAEGTELWGQRVNPPLTACCSSCAADVLAGLLPNGPEGETFPLYLWLPCAQQILLPRLPHSRHEEHPLGTAPGNATPLTVLSLVSRQVCWLTPEQTAGKQKPYMYTQGQAVLNRSFFPGFDTPAVKCTYSATVQVSGTAGGTRGANPRTSPELL